MQILQASFVISRNWAVRDQPAGLVELCFSPLHLLRRRCCQSPTTVVLVSLVATAAGLRIQGKSKDESGPATGFDP